MEYQLRVLDATAYGRVVGVLRSTEGSEVVKLAARCVEVLQAESFARYNSEERRRDWLDLCRAVDARAPVPPIEPFAEVTVALLAMPCFQYSYYERGMATPLSPNLVYLGDDDGGLFGVLRDDPWFDSEFVCGFESRVVEYGVRGHMAVFGCEEAGRIHGIAESIVRSPGVLQNVRDNEGCLEAASRLADLAGRVARSATQALGVSFVA